MSMLVNRERRGPPQRRAAADRGAGVGAPGLLEGRALLRHGASCACRSTRTTAPTCGRPSRSSGRTPPWWWRPPSTYPYGVMDPVAELAALAAEHGVGCHVDACIGGFVLPFLERLGHDVPPWDFRVEGVTEITADVHKYGYCPKGASVILHRDADWFGHQVFVYDELGLGPVRLTRRRRRASPAAPIATAWAVARRPRARRATSRSCGTCWRPSTAVRSCIDAPRRRRGRRRPDRAGARAAVRHGRPVRRRRRDGRPRLAREPQHGPPRVARDALARARERRRRPRRAISPTPSRTMAIHAGRRPATHE